MSEIGEFQNEQGEPVCPEREHFAEGISLKARTLALRAAYIHTEWVEGEGHELTTN